MPYDPPAFPHWSEQYQQGTAGLTRRELMATLILAGMVRDPGCTPNVIPVAVDWTDRLIAELDKPTAKE